MAPRRAYGIALRALGHANPRVVALDADVRNSTYSDYFWQDEALRQRFVECRIAEHNMLSCAGGLAASGKLPFVSTFGKFLIRAYDMVHEAQKALALLKEQGIAATLVDLYSLPFDEAAILGLIQDNQGQVLTVEDNYGAGMGSAVAEMLATCNSAYTLTQMHVRRIPKSGRASDDVLRALQLSASDIAQTAVKMLDVAVR